MSASFRVRPGDTDPVAIALLKISPIGTLSAFDATGFTSAVWRMRPGSGGAAQTFAASGSQLALAVPTASQLTTLTAWGITDAAALKCIATWTPTASDVDDDETIYEVFVRVTLGGVVYDFPRGDALRLEVIEDW